MGYKRHTREKKCLKKLAKKVENTGYPRPVYYNEEDKRYVRAYEVSKGVKPMARYQNRRLRRKKNTFNIPNGGYFRKVVLNAKWDYY